MRRGRPRKQKSVADLATPPPPPTIPPATATPTPIPTPPPQGLDEARVMAMIEQAIRASREGEGSQRGPTINEVREEVRPEGIPEERTPGPVVAEMAPGHLAPIYSLSGRNQPPEFKGTTDPAEAEEWIKSVERALDLFPMSDREKIRYATYQMRGDARIWWELKIETHDVNIMSWEDFKILFNEEYRTEDMLYLKFQEFLTLQQGEMSVKEYSTVFNSLARFAPAMVSTPRSRMEKFVHGLRPEIAQAVMSGLQSPRTYSEALSTALKVEVYINKTLRQANLRAVSSNPLIIVPKGNVGNSSGA